MATPIPATQGLPEIPDKLYFRIGEVSRLAGVKAYVLRYWETEFPGIGPKKSGSNHRLYRRKDVELILEIKQLLYEKRYTIEGARKQLQDQARIQPRVEPRPIAKPAQAAGVMESTMAIAVGASSTGGASTGGGAATGTATARADRARAQATVQTATAAAPVPSKDLVGSIRRELASLLEMLSH